MTLRSTSLLAAVALAGLAVVALAQSGPFDPGPPPPLPEESDAWDGEDYREVEPAGEERGEVPEIVYEAYEVVQPIDDTPGPAARTIEPPEAASEEWAEPAPAPVRRGKLIKLERVAAAPDKRIRIGQ